MKDLQGVMSVDQLTVLWYGPLLLIFDLTSLLPDRETLTGLQRPHTTNLT